MEIALMGPILPLMSGVAAQESAGVAGVAKELLGFDREFVRAGIAA